jgi:EmrB/QacA subfamily drug resistance transporter
MKSNDHISVTRDPAGGEDTYLSHAQIVPILIGLMTAMFLSALDQTIVATAIRTIGDDLQGLSLQAWVTTSYLITATVTTPLYGKFSDIYGRKPLFVFAITIFVGGSALCSLADSMYSLAMYRAIQGLGAGGLFTLALAIIGDIVPPRERAKYQGYFIAVFGSSSVLGPVVGGFFAGHDSILGIDGWRWVFLVNVPLGAIALTVILRTLHLPGFVRRQHRIDWGGVVAINLFLVPLLLLAEKGRDWGWTSSTSALLYVMVLTGLIGFIVAEHRMGDEAIIPLRLFRDRTFSVVAASGLITGAGFFGALLLLPLYMQIVTGVSPTRSGLQLLPLTLGIMFGSIIAGQTISRTGRYKWFPVAGTAIVAVAMLAMTTITVDTPYWRIAVMSGLFGLGMGGIMQPLVLAVQNAVSRSDIGVGTSSVTLFRQLGGTLGAAGFLSIYFSNVRGNVQDNVAAVADRPDFQAAVQDPANAETLGFLEQVRQGVLGFDDTSWLNGADRVLVRPVLEAFAQSQQTVFGIAAGLVAVGFFIILWLPNLSLRERGPAAPPPK